MILAILFFSLSALTSVAAGIYFHIRLNRILAHVKAEDAALLALTRRADADIHADLSRIVEKAKPIFLKVKSAAYATCADCKSLVSRFEVDAAGLAHCLNCIPKGKRR